MRWYLSAASLILTNMSTIASQPRLQYFLTSVPFAIIAIWLGIQFNTVLNSDHAWLMEAAARLLQGGTMSKDFFDPNPPLSILLYIPAALLKMTGIVPLGTAHYFITTFLVLVFCVQLGRLLRHVRTLDQEARTIIIFCFLASNTFLTMAGQFYFGERDQFIWLGLVILCLYQIRLHNEPALPLSWLDIVFMAVSVLFILLKPHYLLIPALFLLVRSVKYRSLRMAFISIDTVCLCAVSLAYLATVILFFPDYVTEILPLLLDIYIQTVNPDIIVSGYIYSSLPIITILLGFIIGLPFKELKAPLICLGLSLLCALLFWIQMKNIYYQLIPCLGFWFLGVGLLSIKLKNRYWRNAPLGINSIILLLLLALAHFIHPPKTAVSHQEYKSNPLYKQMQECAPDCTYFMFTGNMDIIHQISFYSGAKHASRFPVFWWLNNKTLPDNKRQSLQQMALHDLERWQPTYLLIADNITINNAPFDLLSYLSESDRDNILQDYKKAQIVHDDSGTALSNKEQHIKFDLYTRQ